MLTILTKSFKYTMMIVCINFILINSGCAIPEINNTEPSHTKPKYSLSTMADPNETFVIDAYDPWERYNRSMYKFNANFDRKIYLPAVSLYHSVTTPPMREGIHNAFNNLSEVSILINALLQGNFESSWITTQRIVINSTIGILGIFDAANEDHELIRQSHDLGQTLAHYGAKPGPFMILPLFGPSTLRDAIGIAGDYMIILNVDPAGLYEQDILIQYSIEILNCIDLRDNINLEYYQTQSPFEYDMVRFIYLKARKYRTTK